ncbi:type I restriction-modification system subunit M N-terminal domain-containing protein [Pseudarthrobacter albicanus]|uniref:type I restriction-modification system subunit M N-terminal domain-containing protein n=1 Tax=Pseudarthrobacter albicanus TaxID=2823873 RepID=UPI0027DB5144|nr:type I restriction-modification system subunit M N-terminal domain-containing protein [Pseudarthrobacter albicanus]
MITGEIKSQVDKVWNTFWSGGISNPLEIIEQITYLLFLKRLDERHTLQEKKANLLGQPMEEAVFPAGNDPKGRPYADLRWSRFRNFAKDEMFTVFSESVFPFLLPVPAQRAAQAGQR